jgi:hypothetical protein
VIRKATTSDSPDSEPKSSLANLLGQTPAALGTLASVIYLSFFAYNGWIPHDHGMLAQSAERVLAGELPHRDFDEVYSGGLSFFHAGAFWLLGTNLASIRTLLLVCSSFFVWTLFKIASRFLTASLATLVSFNCVVWSLPNYFEAMPSWYTLFLAVLGIEATFKYFETNRWSWLVLAGVCGGLGVAVKIIGLYYIAAVAFSVVYRGHFRTDASTRPSQRLRWSTIAIAGALAFLWLSLVALLIHRHANFMALIQFLGPSIAVSAVLIVSAVRCQGSVDSLKKVIVELSVFVLGVAIPIILLLIPYVVTSSVSELIQGVFVKPRLRIDAVTYSLPSQVHLALVLPVLSLLVLGLTPVGKWDRWISLFTALLSILLLYFSMSYLVFNLVFVMVQLSLPVIAIVAACLLLFDRSLTDQRRIGIYLLAAVTSFVTLVQYPFSAPIYFCFVAPLVVVLTLVTLASQPYSMIRVQWTIATFGLVFGIVFLNQFPFFDNPEFAKMDPPIHLLDLPRGGLFLSGRDQEKYDRLVRTIQSNTPNQSNIFAGPDCPEIYFLSERKNPTRTLYELFDPPEIDDAVRLQSILERDIPLVVINLEPSHSRKFTEHFVNQLRSHFPKSETIGNFLVVYK